MFVAGSITHSRFGIREALAVSVRAQRQHPLQQRRGVSLDVDGRRSTCGTRKLCVRTNTVSASMYVNETFV